MYERNDKIYKHKIFQMKKVILSFQYEPFILIPKLETSNEEEKRGHIDGAGPLRTKTRRGEMNRPYRRKG
jgi:hypothetical protein